MGTTGCGASRRLTEVELMTAEAPDVVAAVVATAEAVVEAVLERGEDGGSTGARDAARESLRPKALLCAMRVRNRSQVTHAAPPFEGQLWTCFISMAFNASALIDVRPFNGVESAPPFDGTAAGATALASVATADAFAAAREAAVARVMTAPGTAGVVVPATTDDTDPKGAADGGGGGAGGGLKKLVLVRCSASHSLQTLQPDLTPF